MRYNNLGDTGLIVSELCFGSLTLSPLQRNLSIKESSYLLEYAYDKGINFIDTSDFYNNYDKIKPALQCNNKNYVICSKSYAYDKKTARESVEKALIGLNRDYIDIFCLHEQESELTLKGHSKALEEFVSMKKEGKIRAIGISTHYVKGVRAAAKHPLIEVVQTITNYQGLGIVDGNMREMELAINELKQKGKAVYGMKPLGGGNLRLSVEDSFRYVRSLQDIDSCAIGVQNVNEIDFAVNFYNSGEFDNVLGDKLTKQKRQLIIADWCTGCGKCVLRCQQNALTLVNNKAIVDNKKCYLCGYCSKACIEFCIKII